MKTILALGTIVVAGCSDRAPSGENPSPLPPVVGLPTPFPDDGRPVLRFVAVGDTGTGNPSEYRIADQIGRKCAESGCDFLAFLGDNVYPEGVFALYDPQWETAVRLPYLTLGYRVRPVLGNHDYGALLPDPIRGELQVAYSSLQPLWQMPARFYVVEEGPALLEFLDTAPVDYDALSTTSQVAFFRSALESSAKPWRLAFGHRPLLSNGSEHPSADGDRAVFLRSILCEGVDVYFAGHAHHREVFAPPPDCSVTQVISGTGAKTSTVDMTIPALFTNTSLGFAYVTVTPDALTIEMLDADGRTDFTTTLGR